MKNEKWKMNIHISFSIYNGKWKMEITVCTRTHYQRVMCSLERIAPLPWCSPVCLSVRLGRSCCVYCDHTVHVSADLSLFTELTEVTNAKTTLMAWVLGTGVHHNGWIVQCSGHPDVKAYVHPLLSPNRLFPVPPVRQVRYMEVQARRRIKH